MADDYTDPLNPGVGLGLPPFGSLTAPEELGGEESEFQEQLRKIRQEHGLEPAEATTPPVPARLEMSERELQEFRQQLELMSPDDVPALNPLVRYDGANWQPVNNLTVAEMIADVDQQLRRRAEARDPQRPVLAGWPFLSIVPLRIGSGGARQEIKPASPPSPPAPDPGTAQQLPAQQEETAAEQPTARRPLIRPLFGGDIFEGLTREAPQNAAEAARRLDARERIGRLRERIRQIEEQIREIERGLPPERPAAEWQIRD